MSESPEEGAPAWETLADGVRVRRMVEGNGAAIMLYRLEPGRRFEEHDHPFAELGVVLTGRGTFRIGGEYRPVRGGDSYFIAGGVPHGFEVVSSDPVVLLHVAVPLFAHATDEMSDELLEISRRTARAPTHRSGVV